MLKGGDSRLVPVEAIGLQPDCVCEDPQIVAEALHNHVEVTTGFLG